MTPAEVADILTMNPDACLRVRLSTGERITIKNPRKTIVDPYCLYVCDLRRPTDLVGRRIRITRLEKIAAIERLGPRGRGRARR